MALGAARMVKFGVLTKQPQTVESLGSATVICTDKTGTITTEGMTVAKLYDAETRTVVTVDDTLTDSARKVLLYARLASELEPFDPMERAIVVAYDKHMAGGVDDKPASIHHEYPLAGTPPMMTHLYALDGDSEPGSGQRCRRTNRAGVSPSRSAETEKVQRQAEKFIGAGLSGARRGGWHWSGADYPKEQDDFDWTFLGLLALENPPKPNARHVIDQFEQAGNFGQDDYRRFSRNGSGHRPASRSSRHGPATDGPASHGVARRDIEHPSG